jgi:hypothetical protein
MVHDWAAQRSCAARSSRRITLPLAEVYSRQIGLVEEVERDGKAWLNRREVRQWVVVTRAAVALAGALSELSTDRTIPAVVPGYARSLAA